MLSRDKYITLPLVIISFNLLLDKIDYLINKLDNMDNRQKKDEILLLPIQAGLDKMLKHYQKTNWVYCVALILDSRHKIETFELTKWGKELKKV